MELTYEKTEFTIEIDNNLYMCTEVAFYNKTIANFKLKVTDTINKVVMPFNKEFKACVEAYNDYVNGVNDMLEAFAKTESEGV